MASFAFLACCLPALIIPLKAPASPPITAPARAPVGPRYEPRAAPPAAPAINPAPALVALYAAPSPATARPALASN